jgi:hypothetical protein
VENHEFNKTSSSGQRPRAQWRLTFGPLSRGEERHFSRYRIHQIPEPETFFQTPVTLAENGRGMAKLHPRRHRTKVFPEVSLEINERRNIFASC